MFRVLRLLGIAILPVAVVILAIFFGYRYTRDALYQSNFFKIKNIAVEGAPGMDQALIENLSGVRLGDNLWQVNVEKVRERMEDHASIRSAAVMKVLPDEIQVVVEREVPRLLVNAKGLHYLNADGKLYDRVLPGDALGFPLVQLESLEMGEKTKKRLEAALQIVSYLEKSKQLSSADLGDIWIRAEHYRGLAPLELTLSFPPKTLRKTGDQRLLTVSLAETDVEQQLRRLEKVIAELVSRRQIPAKVRMEFEKKVVVTIAQ